MDNTPNKFDLIEESDRGAVIVGAALLEDDLDKLLENALKKRAIPAKHVKEMFHLSGPLSSFSSKALICYGFGLISSEIFCDLTKIRKLRNEFAHSTEEVDFMSPKIENLVAEIKCCVEASKDFGRQWPSKDKASQKALRTFLKGYDLRANGFLKYTKAVFCIGISLLRIKILQHDLLRLIQD